MLLIQPHENQLLPSLADDSVLLVGEGDFSFARAIARSTRCWPLTASSYDQLDELLLKYGPISQRTLSLLHERGVRVLHGVNATALHRIDLLTPPYAWAVFNHPHCGAEDSKRHARLVAHFMWSAKQIARVLWISCSAAQAKRWRMEDYAFRLNLKLLAKPVPLDDEAFPGFSPRRHTSGRSFRTVLRGGRRVPQITLVYAWVQSSDIDGATQALSHAAECEHPLAQFLLHPRTSEGERMTAFTCDRCDLRFSTLQGATMHHRNVHELGLYDKSTALRCVPCGGRLFVGIEAFEQHRLAKHNGGQDIPAGRPPLPTSIESEEEYWGSGPFECEACTHRFQTQADFEKHLLQLDPETDLSSDPSTRCSMCGKMFPRLRDMMQHRNASRCNQPASALTGLLAAIGSPSHELAFSSDRVADLRDRS